MKRHSHKSRRPGARKGKGETLEVTIERILPGGLGLAHAEGRTVLVGLSAPGDRLRVEVERTRGPVAFARIKEVLAAGPARIDPPCPYFGRCGGCDFQQLDYHAQLDAKAGIIRDCLRRIARMEPPAEITVTPSPLEWRYRARAQWQHDARAHRLGYFERGSHSVCDVAECPVLVPDLELLFSTLRERMREGALWQTSEDFQAVAGDSGVSLAPSLNEEGTREVSRAVGEYSYRFSAEGFFQINHSLLPALVSYATHDASGDTCLDLYCGVGLFTLPLASRFNRVTAVEGNPTAVAYARRNLSDAQLNNATIECASVGEWLNANATVRGPVDLLLLDPPRTGAEEGAVGGILAMRPKRIIYVSCDPATLARDLRSLFEGGYTLDAIRAFDMFPQTHHVETVVHLSTG